MAQPKITMSQGAGRYLLDLDGERGQIVDTRRNQIFPAQSIHSILARGFWEPIEMGQAESDAIVGMIING